MSKQQYSLMKFDPTTCEEKPYPSNAEQYRKYHGTVAWLFNPWTGDARNAYDIGSDTFVLLILPPGEPLFAASELKKADTAKCSCDEHSACSNCCDSPMQSAQPDAEGWIEWNGGECPVEEGTIVDVKFANGDSNGCGIVPAEEWDWSRGDAFGFDIIAYRVVK